MDIHDLKYDLNSSCLFFDEFNKSDNFKIFAHKNESLRDHIQKTKIIFNNLSDEKIFFNFYDYFAKNKYLNISFNQFKDILEDFIFFHDIGKLSFSFQIKRVNKKNFHIRTDQENFLKEHDIYNFIDIFEANHSLSSALSFISKYNYLLKDNGLFIMLLAFSIYGHHSSLKDVVQNEFCYKDFSYKDINTIYCLLLFLNIANLNEIENSEFDQRFFQNIQDGALSKKTPKDSNFSFFYNYIYSLLISADVLASKKYDDSVDDIKKIDFNNRIDFNLKSKMIKSFYNVSYNKNVNNESYCENLSNIHDINLLRKNMLLESSFNLNEVIKHKKHNNVFFLNMPTGGGKTNTSMKLALDLIENTHINRIIYAMPFINIIDQNYDIIRDNFNLDEDGGEIRKIYSATETIFNDEEEFKSKIILQDNFFNYPVICTTFSTFFDSILRAKKGYKYKVSSLANSVVILDEIQSLPLVNWNSLYYLINELAKKYNIFFIIMSATLPQFNKLKIDCNNEIFYDDAIQLIPFPEDYFNHYLFDRVNICGNIEELFIDEKNNIKNYLLNEIIKPNFEIGYNKGLIVLNTIKSSKLIYDLLSSCDDFEIDLLNSSLLSNVKKEIIYKINNMRFNDSKKYILISTQSIEAGVDVSFDFVVRDFTILDSIEQVKGRCNRSRELNQVDPYKKGNVYLINLKDKNNNLFDYIYDEHEQKSRILETKKLLSNKLNYNYEDIKQYYNNVSDNINNLEDIKEKNFIFNDRDNIKNWNNLEYSKLAEKTGIHIINNQLNQYSIFIPIDMKIYHGVINEFFDFERCSENELKSLYYKYNDNFVFSLKELLFLKRNNNGMFGSFIKNNFIIGETLICYYETKLNDLKNDLNSSNILKNEFSSILNKFLINVSLNNEEVIDKVLFEFRKLGYFYIMDKENVGDDEYSLYSIVKGLNDYPNIVEIL